MMDQDPEIALIANIEKGMRTIDMRARTRVLDWARSYITSLDHGAEAAQENANAVRASVDEVAGRDGLLHIVNSAIDVEAHFRAVMHEALDPVLELGEDDGTTVMLDKAREALLAIELKKWSGANAMNCDGDRHWRNNADETGKCFCGAVRQLRKFEGPKSYDESRSAGGGETWGKGEPAERCGDDGKGFVSHWPSSDSQSLTCECGAWEMVPRNDSKRPSLNDETWATEKLVLLRSEVNLALQDDSDPSAVISKLREIMSWQG